jgi:hypothetical protein
MIRINGLRGRQKSKIWRSRILAEQALAQERRSLALKMLQEDIPLETIARITGFAIAQLQGLQGEL